MTYRKWDQRVAIVAGCVHDGELHPTVVFACNNILSQLYPGRCSRQTTDPRSNDSVVHFGDAECYDTKFWRLI
jgi:hypothetical protein